MIPIATLVRVRHEMFMGALGIVLERNDTELLVRLGNGILLNVRESDAEVIDYIAGSGTPCVFAEDVVVNRALVRWRRKLKPRRSD